MEDITKLIAAIAQLQKEALSEKIESLIKSNKPEHAWRSSEINELATALSKAQGEMKTADLNRNNPYFKSKYADLLSIVMASRPALSKNGLSVVQDILMDENGSSILYTILLHTSGQYIESRMRINPPKNDIQSIGSYVTYLKRMAYASLVGVVTGDEDDDGEVAMVEAREIVAKGPSNKYNPKDQSYETITKEQLEELEYELQQYPDLAEEILDKMRIQSLADLPKSKYMVSIQRIREIKLARSGGK